MLSSLLIAAFAAAKDPTYGACDAKIFAQSANVGKNYTIKPALSQTAISISGDFYIIDGCSFGLRNFVFYNAQQTTMVGSYPGSTAGITLSSTPVAPSASPSTQKFTFVSSAGSAVNWAGFSEVRFFDAGSKLVIATVSLPDPSSPGSAPDTTGSGNSGSSSSPAATGGNNGAGAADAFTASALGFLFGFLFI